MLDKAKGAGKFVLFMVAFVAVLYGASLPYAYFLGREQGEACTMSNHCTQGHWFGACVRGDGPSYCAARCDSDAECPAAWQCAKPPHLPDNYCLRPR